MACWVTGNFPLPNVPDSVLLSNGPPPLLRVTTLRRVTPTPWADTLLLLLAAQLLAKKNPRGKTFYPARVHPMPSICDTASTLNFASLVILPRTTGPRLVLLLLRKNRCRTLTTVPTAMTRARRCRPTVLTNFRVPLIPFPVQNRVLPLVSSTPLPRPWHRLTTLAKDGDTASLGTRLWPR